MTKRQDEYGRRTGEFDLRAYLLDIDDGEERARAIHEGGWGGLPEIEDIEASVANSGGGPTQRLLAALGPPPGRTPKRALQRFERLRAAHPHIYGPRPQEMAAGTGTRVAEAGGTTASAAVMPTDGAAVGAAASAAVMPTDAETGGTAASAAVVMPPDAEAGGTAASAAMMPTDSSANQASSVATKTPTPTRERLHIFPPGWLDGNWEWPKGYRPPATLADIRSAFGLGPPKPTRSSDLRLEVVRVYTAIAFAMRQHGAVMNTHVVIMWETLHVHDHGRATKILAEYLNQAKKWGAVGKVGEPRRRRRERTGAGFDFRYVYIHENATQMGFHTHILCTVPRDAAKAFEAWSRKTLARLARHCGDGRTVRVVPSKAKTDAAAVSRCWNWFRYISKQLGPNAGWGRAGEAPRPLREILKVWPYRTARPVTCAQLAGGSRDIWTKAQQEAGFESRLHCGDLSEIYAGRELDEWRQWCASAEIREVLRTLRI